MTSHVKFQRNFVFTATSTRFEGTLSIGSPFTIEFDIKRDNYAKANHAILKLYNLSLQHRNLLLHDQYDHSVSTQLNIVLSAGYGPGPYWPVIFKGVATRAYSYRDGVDFITVLDCFDGGLAFTNATTNRQFSTGQTYNEIFDQLITQDLLPFGVSLGAVTKQLGTLARGVSFSGNTIEILAQLSNSNVFIDNLKCNILLPADAIGGSDVVLNAQSGLLGTPIKEQYIIHVNLLFEPRLTVGSVITLDSITSVNTYNGPHKVVGISHRGIISPYVAGEAVTTVNLQSGNFTQLSQAGV